MPNQEEFAQRWDLGPVEFLTQTACGHIYKTNRAGKPLILKIYTEIGAEDEKHGAKLLELCKGKGAVEVIEKDDQAVLLEYCDGMHLEELVEQGRDEEATQIIVQTLNKIHKIKPPDASGFTPLSERFSALFDIVLENKGSLFRKAAAIAEDLLENQSEICLLHGDMHHNNILHSSERGWLAIDPKGLVGDRAYDFANTFYNPGAGPGQTPPLAFSKSRFECQLDIISGQTNIKSEKLIHYAFAHGALSASWSITDNQNPDHALKVAGIIQDYL